jgi:hypothetical protein
MFSDNNNFTCISDLYLGCCIHYPGQYPSFKQQCVNKSINYEAVHYLTSSILLSLPPTLPI